jgi:hypothetical protein
MSRQPVDESLEARHYMKLGIADPALKWSADDYRVCRDLLMALSATNRAMLPRMESAKSGALFGRLVNPTNTLLLGDRSLPSNDRIKDFYGVLNRMPAFQDIYRYDTHEPVFHREVIELGHAFLRMMGSAVEWDGKELPRSESEPQGVTFRLAESSRTYVESFLNLEANKSAVPRSERFIIVGAYAAKTLRSLLPWLTDASGQPVADQLRAIRYLKEDMPALWPHISESLQTETLEELKELHRRASSQDLRQGLDELRRELARR